MKCPAIEVLYRQITWLRLQVHSFRCHVSAWFELLGGGRVNVSRIAGEFRLCTGEFKTAHLANDASASIATHEPLALEGLLTCLDCNSVLALMKVSDGEPTPDFYAQSF